MAMTFESEPTLRREAANGFEAPLRGSSNKPPALPVVFDCGAQLGDALITPCAIVESQERTIGRRSRLGGILNYCERFAVGCP